MTSRFSLSTAALVGATGVAAGAFGAHGLEGKLPEDLMEIYQTASLYHLLHAPVLLGIALFFHVFEENRGMARVFQFFFAGVLVFSGSLYLLALSGVRWWGAITPIGGTLLILAWIGLLFVRLEGGKPRTSQHNQS